MTRNINNLNKEFFKKIEKLKKKEESKKTELEMFSSTNQRFSQPLAESSHYEEEKDSQPNGSQQPERSSLIEDNEEYFTPRFGEEIR